MNDNVHLSGDPDAYICPPATESKRDATFGRVKLTTWLFVVLWPILAALFVYFVCLNGATVSVLARYLSCVLIFASGVSASVNAYVSDRMFSYQVRIPAVIWTDRGVRILADERFDPLLSSVLVRSAWTLLTFGLVALMYTDPVDGTPAVVSVAIFVGIGTCLLGTVVYFWWKRRRRKQYPGDIDLSAEGMYQRLGDRVFEVLWKDLRTWKGLVHKFHGETYGLWEVIAGYQVNRRAFAASVQFSSRRPQKFVPLLNSVGDVRKFNILLGSARCYPGWVTSLFTDPNRIDRMLRILTLDGPPYGFMEVTETLSKKSPDLPLSYVDLTMLDLSLPTSLLKVDEDSAT